MFKWKVIFNYYENETRMHTPEYYVFAEDGDSAIKLAKELDGNNKTYTCSEIQVIEKIKQVDHL